MYVMYGMYGMYGMVWCGMVWYGVVWCGMVWYGMHACMYVWNCVNIFLFPYQDPSLQFGKSTSDQREHLRNSQSDPNCLPWSDVGRGPREFQCLSLNDGQNHEETHGEMPDQQNMDPWNTWSILKQHTLNHWGLVTSGEFSSTITHTHSWCLSSRCPTSIRNPSYQMQPPRNAGLVNDSLKRLKPLELSTIMKYSETMAAHGTINPHIFGDSAWSKRSQPREPA